MSTITVTGTADQIRRMAHLLEEAADESTNPRSVTVSLDNAAGTSTVSVSSGGKKHDG